MYKIEKTESKGSCRPIITYAGSMQAEEKYVDAVKANQSDLGAKEACFCFDDEIICLGAGISSTADSPVMTTIDRREIADGMPIFDEEKTYTGVGYFNIEGHAGYKCLDDKGFSVKHYALAEAGGQQFVEIGVDHGKCPTDSSYAYAILPYATNERLEKYDDIEIDRKSVV